MLDIFLLTTAFCWCFFIGMCLFWDEKGLSGFLSALIQNFFGEFPSLSFLHNGTVLRSKMLKKYPMEPGKHVPVTMMGYSALKPQNYDDVLRKYKLL
jgi:hypothetical protein